MEEFGLGIEVEVEWMREGWDRIVGGEKVEMSDDFEEL